MNPLELPRVFIGCLVDLGATRRVTELSVSLRRRATESGWAAAWVNPSAFHITLRFLGELDPGLLTPLSDLVSQVASAHPAPKVTLTGVRAFPSDDAPRVLYVGVSHGADALQAIANSLDAGLDALGFPPRDLPFHPHLTLARVRHAPGPVSSLASEQSDHCAATVRDLTLWRSGPTRPTVEYPVLARTPFGVSSNVSAPATQSRNAKP